MSKIQDKKASPSQITPATESVSTEVKKETKKKMR